VIRPNPVTIQLRYLQALSEISANQGTTIVFPLPMDVLRPLIEAGTGNGAEASERKRTERPERPAGSHELTEGEPEPAPERELTEGEPEPAPERELTEGELTEGEPAPLP
jgi:hypothetical protein